MRKKGRTMVRLWNRYLCPAIEYTVMGIGIALIVAAVYIFNVLLILAVG